MLEEEVQGMIQPLMYQSRGAGVSIQLAEWPGNGKTVFGVHGLTANCRCWDALAGAISPENRFLALDLRGRGLSDKPGTGYSIPDHCQDIHNILEHEKLGPVTLIGHSLGAYISLTFAAKYPKRVQGLILIDGGANLSQEQWARISSGIKPSLDRLGRVFQSFEAYTEQIKQAPFLKPWNDMLEQYFQYESKKGPNGFCSRILPEHIEEEQANLVTTDFSSLYPKVGCPVLILRAAQGMLTNDDLVLPEEAMPRFLADLPQAELVNLQGMNHFSILFQGNAERDRAIRDFLQKNP